MNIELSPGESEILAGILDEHVSELRMEIADTDSMDVREDLKSREALAKRVAGDLRRGMGSPRDVTGARNSPSR